MTDTTTTEDKSLNAPLNKEGSGGGVVVSLLVAADKGNVIGKNNQLPWHLPNDLKYFKNLTWGLPVVMGRKTYESIGKPLPGRTNIVITRNRDYSAAGINVVHAIADALRVAQQKGAKEIFVIGGAEIFHSVFENADRIYLTRIHHRFEGDVFFPELNEDWQLVKAQPYKADEKNKYDHTFQVWERASRL